MKYLYHYSATNSSNGSVKEIDGLIDTNRKILSADDYLTLKEQMAANEDYGTRWTDIKIKSLSYLGKKND